MEKVFRAKTTIEQWRIFHAVVEHGSYAKASDALNKSQSSLNHAVAKLQSQLGLALLEVEGRQTKITEAGTAMLRRSKKLLEDIQSIEDFADTLNGGWEAEITIACEVLYPKHRLLKALQQYWPQSHGSRLKITDEVISGSTEAIKNKSADIVLSPSTSEGFRGNHLCSTKLIPVCHRSHEIHQQESISSEELARHLQVVISDTGKAKPDKGWLKSEKRWTVSSFFEASTILKQGIGFCWLPCHLIESEMNDGSLKAINLEGSAQIVIPVTLVIPDRENAGPGVLLLEKIILAEHKSDRE
ncbi:LysR family transcriptional regulator [Thalassotalea fonticola]|uniref:LysR family transcriptional regulator n=1 Tax=Thalassotalea fonticola TaxID=3065649 RepID=A0ABZ0GRI7_9GAMM|nr:LysR family transcriptional regulator [Colwelliaceae bacterium S1-1]